MSTARLTMRRQRRAAKAALKKPRSQGRAEMDDALRHIGGHSVSICCPTHRDGGVFPVYGGRLLSFECGTCRRILPLHLRVGDDPDPELGLSATKLTHMPCDTPGCNHKGHVLRSMCHVSVAPVALYAHGILDVRCGTCEKFVAAIQVGL